MENTVMKKKEYMQPEVLAVLLNTRQQMLTGSVKSTGLEDDLELSSEDGDVWDDAMSRKSDGFDDED
jgi:hypothetical protein